MLKIGEISVLSQISIHMLRHYDEIGLLIPEHVDDFTGHSFSGDGELMLSILASFAQEEVRSPSENSKWGIRKSYQNGTDGVRNKKVLGYRYDGEKYVVKEDEAEVVRFIFAQTAAGVAAELIQKCIGENARIAQKQGEYAKRYDALVEQFETAKARLEEVQAAITEKQAQRKMMENFMDVLSGMPEQVDNFDEAAWYAMVNFVTVYGKDDVRFTFKNGIEIKT